MSQISTALAAGCLALASLGATAQTESQPGKPPTHPTTGQGAAAPASPTHPPSHPAGVSTGATPEAAASNKDSTADDAKKANAQSSSRTGAGGTSERSPAGTNATTQGSMPRQPAAPSK